MSPSLSGSRPGGCSIALPQAPPGRRYAARQSLSPTAPNGHSPSRQAGIEKAWRRQEGDSDERNGIGLPAGLRCRGHVHRLRPVRRTVGRHPCGEMPDNTRGPLGRSSGRPGAVPLRRSRACRPHAAHRARHHPGRQRGDRAQGRPHGAPHDQGFPRCAGASPPRPGDDLRTLGRSAGPACAAATEDPHRRAHL